MKLSLFATILVSPVLVLTTAPSFAEETLDRYTYNGDGTYKKEGTNETLPSESPNSGNSASLLETKGGYKKFYDLGSEFVTWNLRGSHASRFSNGFNFQLDGEYQYQNSSAIEENAIGGTVHLAYHIPDSYALGVFGHASLIDTNWTDNTIAKSGFGVESAAFLQDATLYGRVGYENATVDDKEADTFYVQGGVRYFVNDNIRLDFDARYQEDAVKITTAGNYRLQDSPVSLFGGYTYENIDAGALGNYDAGLFFAGLRVHFDSDSLRGEEKDGLIWSTIN